ncbi:hypothetical protein [uncultured Allomuricauda sp.]|uniref:hypothetical protein n=1 Tax=Flagellimonas sp. W118 TaxID=3410791 RepID=UPI00261422B8|nr:hypothetical protein [uncultured Allomuricauda sp.]
MKQMIPWKQTLITALAVYPLLLFFEWAVKQILPVHQMDRRAVLFIVVVMIATSMVFVVMPLMIKLFGRWLFKNNNN